METSTIKCTKRGHEIANIPVPFFSIHSPWLGVLSPSFSNPNVKTNHN